MRLRNVAVCTWGVTLAVSLIACGGGGSSSSSSATPAAPAATGGKTIDASKVGNVTGMIMFEGTAPKNEPIKMNADPVCAKASAGTSPTQETYAVSADGKSLGNVFVYVKSGLDGYSFPTPTDPVTIDQQNCHYVPHVFGIMAGQQLTIVNSDMTLHNIHALPKANKEFNTAMPVKDMKINHVFDSKEVMVPFKCEVHGWMNAYMGVLDHPFYSVSTKDGGKFELKGLPPGTYEIEAWHEKLGAQTQSVTIGDSETKDIMFTFKAPAAATN